MAENNSTTEKRITREEKIERLKKDYAGITKAKDLIGAMAGIACQGMIAAGGGEFGREGLEYVLKEMESPWIPEHLREHTYQAILKLAGEAWCLINECVDPEHFLKETTPAPLAAPPELNAYDPKYANAKISVAALWEHLEALEAIADDPAKVKAWAEKIHDELGKCEAA